MFWYEWLVFALLIGSGMAIAQLFGVRGWLLRAASGLLFGTLWRVTSFAICNALSWTEWAWALWALGAVGAIALALNQGLRAWLPGLGVSAGLGFAAASMRLFGLAGTPHSDSIWIFTLSDLMSSDQDMAILNGRTSIKRGFSYPLLLALGRDGEHLTAVTPLIAVSVLLAALWLARELLGAKLRSTAALTVAGVLGLAMLTATVPLRSLFYINGHTLVALGLLLLAGIGVLATRDGRLQPGQLAIAMAAIAVVSTTRPEGIALAALVALPLISQSWLKRWQIVALVSSATLPLGIWLAVYDSYILSSTGIWWPIFTALLVGLGAVLALPWLDWLRERAVPIALGGMVLALLAAVVFFFGRLRGGLVALWENLALGEGLWGFTLVGLLAVTLVIGWRKTTVEYQTLLVTSALLILGTLIAKMLDGGQFGEPTLGRIGWSDSLNRMWIHGFAIFVVTTFIGIVQRRKTAA